MKILQVISTPPFVWETGGCARVAFDISMELIKRGHDITLATTDMLNNNQRYKNIKNPEVFEGLKIYRFKNISNFLAWKYYIYSDIGILFYLYKNIKKFDFVHLHDFRSFQTIATSYFCTKNNIPYIIQPHGAYLTRSMTNTPRLLLDLIFTDYAIAHSSYIVALTLSEKKDLMGLGIEEKKIIIVPNALNVNDYQSLPKQGIFRKTYGIKEDEKIILYVGRLHKTKGIDLLIKVFAEITKEQENLKLVIIGNDDGYLEEILFLLNKLKIADKVAIIGFVDDKDKISAYVDADIVVYPRNREPFGLTILEACACGTPVICSNTCGIAEYINNIAGLTFNYNFESLKKAITELLTNSELLENFSSGGKQLIATQFTPKKIVDDVETIYEKAILTNKKKLNLSMKNA